MTTVDTVAVETGRPVDDVLEHCERLGITASSAESGLSRHEHERLRVAMLGEDHGLPPVEAGSTTTRPETATAVDERTLVERARHLDEEKAKPRVAPRLVIRAVIYTFLLIAVGVAVVTLRGRAEEGVDVPVFDALGTADVGSCIDLDESGAGPQVAVVDCADPHDAELFAVVELPDDETSPHPGAEQLSAIGDERCEAAFEPYVGAPHESSSLEVLYLAPTPATWSLGDRTILCLIEDRTAPLVGSVAGTGR